MPLAELLGREEAERYRAFSKWSTAAMGCSVRPRTARRRACVSLASIADLTRSGRRRPASMQALFAPPPAGHRAALRR